MKAYARLKRQLRFKASGDTHLLCLRRPPVYQEFLDPDLRIRLERALQRPDLRPETRAKILEVLGNSTPSQLHPNIPFGSQYRPVDGFFHAQMEAGIRSYLCPASS